MRVGSCSAGSAQSPPSLLAQRTGAITATTKSAEFRAAELSDPRTLADASRLDRPAFQHSSMEHRWGARYATGSPVWLLGSNGTHAFGTLLNVSLSGAYVLTSAHYHKAQRLNLQVELGLRLKNRIAPCAAFVARLADRGMGLEWDEIASESVLAMLAAIGLVANQL
jgi:hypothetical protein